MLTSDESRQLLRTGRLQNARYWFFKDPLAFLDEIQLMQIPLADAFHCAGPSLGRAAPMRLYTEREMETMRETAEALAEAKSASYGLDYDEWSDRNLALTGRRYTGD